MESLGNYDGKRIYLFSGRLAELRTLTDTFPSANFVCTFFFHNTVWSKQELQKALRCLIDRGAVLFLFHGRGCGDAHDLAHEVQMDIIPENQMTSRNVIGATCYERHSEEHVIFATFCASLPAADYIDQFRSYLIVSLGTPEENNRVRKYLENLQITIQKVVNEGDNGKTG